MVSLKETMNAIFKIYFENEIYIRKVHFIDNDAENLETFGTISVKLYPLLENIMCS